MDSVRQIEYRNHYILDLDKNTNNAEHIRMKDTLESSKYPGATFPAPVIYYEADDKASVSIRYYMVDAATGKILSRGYTTSRSIFIKLVDSGYFDHHIDTWLGKSTPMIDKQQKIPDFKHTPEPPPPPISQVEDKRAKYICSLDNYPPDHDKNHMIKDLDSKENPDIIYPAPILYYELKHQGCRTIRYHIIGEDRKWECSRDCSVTEFWGLIEQGHFDHRIDNWILEKQRNKWSVADTTTSSTINKEVPQRPADRPSTYPGWLFGQHPNSKGDSRIGKWVSAIIEASLVFGLPLGIVWVGLGFILMDWDVTKWDKSDRLTMISASLFFLISYALLKLGTKPNDPEEHQGINMKDKQ